MRLSMLGGVGTPWPYLQKKREQRGLHVHVAMCHLFQPASESEDGPQAVDMGPPISRDELLDLRQGGEKRVSE